MLFESLVGFPLVSLSNTPSDVSYMVEPLGVSTRGSRCAELQINYTFPFFVRPASLLFFAAFALGDMLVSLVLASLGGIA